MDDRQLLREALAEAKLGLQEGGLPIGFIATHPDLWNEDIGK